MAARDEVDRNRSSYPPMFSANCRPGMARESEGRRRHLNYVGGSEGLGAGPPHSEGVRDRRKAIAMPRRSSVCLPALICSSRPSTLQGRVCELSVPGRPRGRHLGDRPKAGDRAPVKWTWRSLEIEIRQRDVPGPSVEEPRDRRRRRTSVWRQAAVARCLSRQLGGGRHPPRLGRQPVGADPMVGNPRAPRAADRELN